MRKHERAVLAPWIELAEQAEAQEGEGRNHLVRMSRMASCLTNALAQREQHRAILTPGRIRILSLAIQLHDIGKLDIPVSILHKPAALTADEFRIVQTHAEAGAKRLEAALRTHPGHPVLEAGVVIARHHHEQWRGGGYPDGLDGEAIPLEARIAAVVDVYEALRTNRAHRRAFPHRLSIDIMMSEKGRQFDPDIVDTLAAIESRFAAIRRRLPG